MKIFILIILFTYSLFSKVDQKQLELGEKLYKNTCISCHGVNGEGNDDMNLIVKSRNLSKSILTKEQTYFIIKDGAHYWGAKSDIMPAFKYVFKDYEIRALSSYISEIFNPNIKQTIKKEFLKSGNIIKENISKMLKVGEKVFKRNCSLCHGIKGEGDGIAIDSLEDSIFPYNLTKTILSTQQMFLYVKYGGHAWGTHKSDMPAWGKKYDNFTLKSVVKYVDEVLRDNKY